MADKISGQSKRIKLNEEIKNPLENIEQEEENEDTEVFNYDPFVEYEPVNLNIDVIKRHPTALVETITMAGVHLPNLKYKTLIPKDVYASGNISDAQAEAHLYCVQKTSEKNAMDKYKAFFLGDGTGVGKTRILLSVIWEYQLSHKISKALWVSSSAALQNELKKDVKELGMNFQILDYEEIEESQNIKDGILFITYTKIIDMNKARNVRVWLGKGFEGVIILDECHKAKDKNTSSFSSVTQLQNELNARFVFSSATGASEISELNYMERLGLWGEGTKFSTFEDFTHGVKMRGVTAMETLSMQLKLTGSYMARQISFKEAEYTILQHDLTKEEITLYDECCIIWQRLLIVLFNLEKNESESTVKKKNNKKILVIKFFSAQQRFFSQLLLCFKIDLIIEEARKALIEKKAVIIGLQSTGEASMKRTVGQVKDLKSDQIFGSFVSTLFEIISSLIEDCEKSITDSEHQKLNIILEKAKCLKLPPCPLDVLIDKLGGINFVAELTGRTQRLIRNQKNEIVFENRCEDSSTTRINQEEQENFMSGKKFVAILSDASSTGISLHSDQRCGNKRQRFHITAELPWSAQKCIQQMGRSNRAHQISSPEYIIVKTNVPGEYRFAAAVAQKLESMGALTKGDRRASFRLNLGKYNILNELGERALLNYTEKISKLDEAKLQEFVTVGIWNNQTKKLKSGVKEKQFLNRVLSLTFNTQNIVVTEFLNCYKEFEKQELSTSSNSKGFVDLGVIAKKDVVNEWTLEISTDEEKLGNFRIFSIKINKGLDWIEAKQMFDSAKSNKINKSQFIMDNQNYNRVYLAMPLGEKKVSIWSPGWGNTGKVFDKNLISYMYKSINKLDEAKKKWISRFDVSGKYCVHNWGPIKNCKRPNCEEGKRNRDHHILVGPTWDVFDEIWELLSKNTQKILMVRGIQEAIGPGSFGAFSGIDIPNVCVEDLKKILKNYESAWKSQSKREANTRLKNLKSKDKLEEEIKKEKNDELERLKALLPIDNKEEAFDYFKELYLATQQ